MSPGNLLGIWVEHRGLWGPAGGQALPGPAAAARVPREHGGGRAAGVLQFMGLQRVGHD